jgi:hypothetical protein
MVFGISVMDFAVRDPSRKKISGVVIPWPYESIPGFGVAPSARIISSFVMGSQKLIRTYSKHPGATRKTGSKMGKKNGGNPRQLCSRGDQTSQKSGKTRRSGGIISRRLEKPSHDLFFLGTASKQPSVSASPKSLAASRLELQSAVEERIDV